MQKLSGRPFPTSENRKDTFQLQSLPLTSGVPQGGILSPILFVIYRADIELWLKYSVAFTYADDTEPSTTGK